MAPATRQRNYVSWVIVVDAKASKPEYHRYATLIHRCTFGNLIMDSIAHLENATFVPTSLDNLMRSIHFYHETCPYLLFWWKNMFLLIIADSAIRYTKRVERIMIIILRWFLLRRGGGLICETDFIRCWRDKRKRLVIRSTIRNKIGWTKHWIMMYFSTD